MDLNDFQTLLTIGQAKNWTLIFWLQNIYVLGTLSPNLCRIKIDTSYESVLYRFDILWVGTYSMTHYN